MRLLVRLLGGISLAVIVVTAGFAYLEVQEERTRLEQDLQRLGSEAGPRDESRAYSTQSPRGLPRAFNGSGVRETGSFVVAGRRGRRQLPAVSFAKTQAPNFVRRSALAMTSGISHCEGITPSVPAAHARSVNSVTGSAPQ